MINSACSEGHDATRELCDMTPKSRKDFTSSEVVKAPGDSDPENNQLE
jgi:hypothetical protein